MTSLKSLGVLDELKEKMTPEGGEIRGRGLGDGLLNIAAAVPLDQSNSVMFSVLLFHIEGRKKAVSFLPEFHSIRTECGCTKPC